MHEMSLCEGIRRVVDQAAADPGITRVTRVRLEIGRFAGVEKPALEFAWQVVMRGSKGGAGDAGDDRPAGAGRSAMIAWKTSRSKTALTRAPCAAAAR